MVWGATFVLVKAALADVSPVLFLALRFTLATVALLVLFRGRGLAAARRSKTTGSRGACRARSCFPAISFRRLGLRLTTAPKSAFITGLTSVMVPLLAALVYRIRPQVSEVAGVLVATAGLALMTLEGAIGPIGRGDLLTFVCAVGIRRPHRHAGPFLREHELRIVVGRRRWGPRPLWSLALFWWVEHPACAGGRRWSGRY